MSELFLLVLFILLAYGVSFVIKYSVRRYFKVIEPNFELEEKSNKHWSKDELIIIAHYVVFIKKNKNDMTTIETLSDGLGRSIPSILRKISIMENISNRDSYNLVRETYDEISVLTEQESEQLLNESIIKVIG